MGKRGEQGAMRLREGNKEPYGRDREEEDIAMWLRVRKEMEPCGSEGEIRKNCGSERGIRRS